MASNPPGVFYHTTLKEAISVGGYVPLFPILEFEGDVHCFLTFDEKKDKAAGADTDRLQSLFVMLSKRVETFNKFLKKLRSKNSPAWKAQMKEDMEKKASEISRANSKLDMANLTVLSFADFVHDLMIETVDLGEKLKMFESRLKLAFDPDGESRIRSLKRAFELVEGQVKGIWWENLDSSTPFFPKDDVMGIKTFLRLTVLGQSLGLEAELLTSSEGVMKCSDLYEYYDHVEGTGVIRGKGIITVRKSGLITTSNGVLNDFWLLFPPAVGGGVELAFSREKPVFTIRLSVIWMWFGLKLSGNLFITNNEVAAMTEATLMQMFRVRLTLRFAVPRQFTDLSLSIRGEFLPGDENSFDSSLWDAVKRVLKAKHREAEKRLTQANENINRFQTDLTSAQKNIKSASEELDQKNLLFDNAVKRLEAAKKSLEKAKEPFLEAKQQLSTAMEKVDRLCKLDDCSRHCSETIDASACKMDKKLKTTCVKLKQCSTWLSKTGCIAKNAGCKVLRGLAYGALAIAKAFVHAPMLALDAAKGAVSLAQILVDKSRFVLDVAKAFYTGVSLGIDLLKASLQLTYNLIETIKVSVKYVYKMFDAFISNVLQRFIDFKRCGFEVELSVKNWFVVRGFCEINFLSKGWAKHSFTINFKDIFTSTFGIAKSMIQGVEEEGGKHREKRETEGTKESRKSSLNKSDTVRTVSFEYQSWPLRCGRYRSIITFLNHSVEILKNISKEILKEAEAADNNINDLESDEKFSEILSLEDLPVDFEVALNEFNLSKDELENALRNAHIENDEVLLATLELKESVRKHNQLTIQSLRDTPVRDSWLAQMNTVSYFGDCKNFQDCVAWSFGELVLLLESLDPRLVGTFRESLVRLQEVFEDVMHNESKTLNETIDPEINVNILHDMLSVYCGTLPVILEHPTNASLLSGDVAMLSCKAKSYPSPTYYWFHGDDLVAPGNSLMTLLLNNISDAHEGFYSCVAGNHIGNVSSEEAFLLVVSPPRILSSLPQRYTLYPGYTKNLKPVVTGTPSADLTWIICSSFRCFSWQSMEFPNISTHFRGEELICKYIAHNAYGSIGSREMFVALHHEELAVPSKHVTFGFTVVIGESDEFETSEQYNDVMLRNLFEETLTDKYVGLDGSLRIDVLKVDPVDHVVFFALSPEFGVLGRAELTKSSLEAMLTDMNLTVEKMRHDARQGVILYNSSEIIYSFSQADEVEDEPTRFFCNGSRIFHRPYYCCK